MQHDLVPRASTPWSSAHGLTGPEMDARLGSETDRQFKAVDLGGYHDGLVERFTAVFEPYDGIGWRCNVGLPLSMLAEARRSRHGEGFRLARLGCYATPEGVKVCALWAPIAGGPDADASYDLDRQQFQQTFEAFRDAGYRPVDISGYDAGGQPRYAAVWEKRPSPSWEVHHHRCAAEHAADFARARETGHVPDRVVGFSVGGETLYCSIWTKRAIKAYDTSPDVPVSLYQRHFADTRGAGYRPTQVHGWSAPGGARVSSLWESDWYDWGTLHEVDTLIDGFLATYSTVGPTAQRPGLSLALSVDGRLVFARARGSADASTGEAMSVQHRMRIASVSKPVTAAAVMLLVQQNRLALRDKVFGNGALLGTTYGAEPYSANEKAITVDDLLRHTSGFDDQPADPMLSEPNRDLASLIGWRLDEVDPVRTPGTAKFYVNFGYCLLGRIIEKVTGQRYQTFIQQALLAPAGVTSMQIAGDTLADRVSDEVAYLGQGEDPYSLKVARMDANGGWIATPADLLRFLRVVDGRGDGDVLSSATVAAMTTVPPASVLEVDQKTPTPSRYARGWGVDGANWIHYGGMAGTVSLLNRADHGIGRAAVVNTRRPADEDMGGKLLSLVTEVEQRLGDPAPFDLF